MHVHMHMRMCMHHVHMHTCMCISCTGPTASPHWECSPRGVTGLIDLYTAGLTRRATRCACQLPYPYPNPNPNPTPNQVPTNPLLAGVDNAALPAAMEQYLAEVEEGETNPTPTPTPTPHPNPHPNSARCAATTLRALADG